MFEEHSFVPPLDVRECIQDRLPKGLDRNLGTLGTVRAEIFHEDFL